jgi:hypothetical protein
LLLLLLLLLLLRRTSLRITNAIPIDHRRGRMRMRATTATEHAAPTGVTK